VEAQRRFVRSAPRQRGQGGAAASTGARGPAAADVEGSDWSSGDSAEDLADMGDTGCESGPASKRLSTVVKDVYAGATATWMREVASTARRGRGGTAAGRRTRRSDTEGRVRRGKAVAEQGACGGSAPGRERQSGRAAGRLGKGTGAAGQGPRGRSAARLGRRDGHSGTPRNRKPVARCPLCTLHQALRH